MTGEDGCELHGTEHIQWRYQNTKERAHPVDVGDDWLVGDTLILSLNLHQKSFFSMTCYSQIKQHLRKIKVASVRRQLGLDLSRVST